MLKALVGDTKAKGAMIAALKQALNFGAGNIICDAREAGNVLIYIG